MLVQGRLASSRGVSSGTNLFVRTGDVVVQESRNDNHGVSLATTLLSFSYII